MNVTFGNFTDTTWPDVRALGWPDLAALLTTHEAGPKEGTCFVPATFRGPRRNKADAAQIEIAVLDCDSGHTAEDIESAVRAHGWRAIIHSTHSHLTTATRAKASHWQRFGAADAEAFLIREKGYLPRVAEGAMVSRTDGDYVMFEHQPCPKFRLVLSLSRPWRAADFADQNAANAKWKERIEALAAALGLSHDQSCTDSSRLFYLPRHPGDAARPPAALVIEGTDCDIWSLPPAPASVAPLPTTNAGSNGGRVEYVDQETGEVFDLTAWAGGAGRRFEIVKALKARSPEQFTGRVVDKVKHHIRCSNDDAHTDPGADGATFIVNASESDNGSFVYHCRHGHCSGVDRLHFVCKMLERGWLTPSDLAAPEFNAGPVRLLVENASPERTVEALRRIFAATGTLFDRGGPVRLAYDHAQSGMAAQVLSTDGLVLEAHRACRPYTTRTKPDGSVVECDVRLPRSIVQMYTDWRGEWGLPPLKGIASAPLLQADGSIHSVAGYDVATGMWCESVPDLSGMVPNRPTRADAEAALSLLRGAFRTFCFADAETFDDAKLGVPVVDLDQSPGLDESSFLVALLTAVCRPSLDLAPGVLLRAAPLSGSGAGKGLLARCISIVAFGRAPYAVTGGGRAEEAEKRIASELLQGSPTLLLDNFNDMAFRSDLLASVLTEQHARSRVLGESRMAALCSSSFVMMTGNGLSISEDLARRFVTIELDARMEDPEARPFEGDFKEEVTRRRAELLAACLAIWRWGRHTPDIKRGKALGSFSRWCRWVRDPLLALGLRDPVERIAETKAQDGKRQHAANIFAMWWNHHGPAPVTVAKLHADVVASLGLQGDSRQQLAPYIARLAGTRAAGYVLRRYDNPGRSRATAMYWLQPTAAQTQTQEAGAEFADIDFESMMK